MPGPNMIDLPGLLQSLTSIGSRKRGLSQLLQMLGQGGQQQSTSNLYDQPPGWEFRKFPGHGMHPAIERMKSATEPAPKDLAVRDILESLKDPEKQDEFLKWYTNQQSMSLPTSKNPEGYY